jgi:aminopeptidase-like protein
MLFILFDIHSLKEGVPTMEIMEIYEKLFPLNRAVSGDGLRKTLEVIGDQIPLIITEHPSNEQCFDWQIPLEWNISDACVMDKQGRKLIDLGDSNLHILAYSQPYKGWVSKKTLFSHLYTLEDMPDAIPYVNSIYEKRWGFCLEHKKLTSFTDDEYYVMIDSSLAPGAISIGEAYIKGSSDKEVMLFTHTGHPSMANDQLSGILSLLIVYEQLERSKMELRYNYRFVFCPETIGTAAFLKHNMSHLKKNLIAGYTVTFTGDNCPLRYKRSFAGNSAGDASAQNAMRKDIIEDFSPFGSDERHFNSPGIELPVGAFMRAGPGGYREYHTSLDNIDTISENSLYSTASKVMATIRNLEADRSVKTIHMGFEPKLDKSKLYSTLGSGYSDNKLAHQILAIWRLGTRYGSLIKIADKLDQNAFDLSEALTKAVELKLVEIV